MSNLELAFAALSLVRDRISLATSDNKRFDDPDPETLDKPGKERYMSRYIKHMNKVQHITTMRKHERNPQRSGGSILNINNYGAYALAAGAGNCLEMSCATAWYLNQQGKFHYALIHYGDGGDHVFVAIGQPAPSDGKYPTDFANWSADAAICDVWADIASPARDYPVRWRARMQNFSVMGLKLASKSADSWTNLVDQPKYSLD